MHLESAPTPALDDARAAGSRDFDCPVNAPAVNDDHLDAPPQLPHGVERRAD